MIRKFLRNAIAGLILATLLPPSLAQQSSSAALKPFSVESDFMSLPGYLRKVGADLVPTGKLRVALNLGLVTLVRKDPASGELRGVAVELGRGLAASLKFPFAPVEYPSVARIVATVKANAWDIAFLALSTDRAADMDFSTAYMNVDDTYLVAAGSRIHTVADADQPGVRIAVPSRAAPDVFLTGTLKYAELLRGDTVGATFELLKTGKAEAMAGERPTLLEFAETLPGSHVLNDYFLVLHHAIGLPKGHAAGVAYVRKYIEQAKASGLVKQAIERAGLRGAAPAPPGAAP